MKNTVFPHKFWRPFLDCMPQLFFRPQYVWFPVHLKGHLIPLCYETLVVNWQNWLFTLFHQSRSVLSPNPIRPLHTMHFSLKKKNSKTKLGKMKYSNVLINSLWPGDAIWRHGTRSTLAQVMACCLTAPSHDMNPCWLIIGEVPWHSSQGIIIRQCEDTNQ